MTFERSSLDFLLKTRLKIIASLQSHSLLEHMNARPPIRVFQFPRAVTETKNIKSVTGILFVYGQNIMVQQHLHLVTK